MIRFFVSEEDLCLEEMVLDKENAAHAKVLRLKTGDEVVACDGAGREAVCSVTLTDGVYCLSRGDIVLSETEAAAKVSIYMALPKADKLEHVIQKATELGAFEIVTFPSARCVSRPDEKSLKKKLERWQKIAASAAEQSGRGRIPEVIVLGDYTSALKRAAEADLSIVFYENEKSNTLHKTLEAAAASTISLLTGPEGGLEAREIEEAIASGFQICTLGKRILRCETAPLCALSAVMYHEGEF